MCSGVDQAEFLQRQVVDQRQVVAQFGGQAQQQGDGKKDGADRTGLELRQQAEVAGSAGGLDLATRIAIGIALIEAAGLFDPRRIQPPEHLAVALFHHRWRICRRRSRRVKPSRSRPRATRSTGCGWFIALLALDVDPDELGRIDLAFVVEAVGHQLAVLDRAVVQAGQVGPQGFGMAIAPVVTDEQHRLLFAIAEQPGLFLVAQGFAGDFRRQRIRLEDHVAIGWGSLSQNLVRKRART